MLPVYSSNKMMSTVLGAISAFAIGLENTFKIKEQVRLVRAELEEEFESWPGSMETDDDIPESKSAM